MNEQFKQFAESDTKLFFVSTEGNLKKIDKATNEVTAIKAPTNTSGRRTYMLPNGKTVYVYRLVAEVFIPNPENKPTVNHIRGLDAGDGVENLEWMTYAEQDEHARRIGLKTSGNTPAIVLDSNGMVITQHDTMTEALTNYNGRNVYYNKDTQIIGNVIVMKQSYYDELSEDERFNICFECFKRITEFAYAIDGQLVDTVTQASQMLNYGHGNLINRIKNKRSIDVKGHTVSRLKNRIGVFNDDIKQGDKIYETVRIK
ncbi:endonuclease [Bacillus cereus]|uniref:endonuclease n=1 Tax=Bacillus cereus TaxID=1396 RepID=UPI000BF5B94B|nr:endonuclease [Bacillus cereus]PFX73741.1 endonuclease [Bacillus cereus]